LGNDIPVLPVTTCATWYTCQSLNNPVGRGWMTYESPRQKQGYVTLWVELGKIRMAYVSSG